MEDLFTDKWLVNVSCSNVKKRKVIVIVYLKMLQNNDTIMIQLALFSTVENNILTKKDVI